MENFNTKKIFLYLLTCSIALSALMGIWAIVSGEFGDLQGKILLTTLTVVGTSILGLACGAFLESPRSQKLKAVPIAGIVCAVSCAVFSFWLIWGHPEFDEKNFFKLFFVSLIFAFSLAQLSLLSMARLAKKFLWSLITAYAVIFILDSIVSAIIIFELSGDDGLVLRLIGVLSVAAASLTVMIPIFHWLSRSEYVHDDTTSTARIDAQIAELRAKIVHLEQQRDEMNAGGERYNAP